MLRAVEKSPTVLGWMKKKVTAREGKKIHSRMRKNGKPERNEDIKR
jgi:hypothetical protein